MCSAIQRMNELRAAAPRKGLPPWVLLLLLAAMPLLFSACANSAPEQPERERGAYLVGLLGCGQCHTDGALLGNPTGMPLAGSSIGIAVSAALDGEPPAVVFPGNLTPDVDTGIGGWSEDSLMNALRHGRRNDWAPISPVMPWQAYANLETADLRAIARFLLSQPAVRNRVPQATDPGIASRAPYVRIGVYLYDEAGRQDRVYLP